MAARKINIRTDPSLLSSGNNSGITPIFDTQTDHSYRVQSGSTLSNGVTKRLLRVMTALSQCKGPH